MRYFFKFVMLIAASLLAITAFASHNPQVYHPQPSYRNCTAPKQAGPSQRTQVVREVPPFSGIEVRDNLRVVIYGDAPTQQVILSGDSGAIAGVSTEVRNGVLYIHAPCSNASIPHYSGRVLVKICLARPLCSLTAAGYVDLSGENIQSNGLNLCVKDASSVQLHGRVNILKIQDDSTGNIDIPWAEGHTLTVNGRGGKGSGATTHIRVNGKADVLTAHLAGGMCLEAEHLHANEVYVRTEDYSIAKVFPEYAMYAFAGGDSNIYYFNKPKQLVRYSQQSGNILLVARCY